MKHLLRIVFLVTVCVPVFSQKRGKINYLRGVKYSNVEDLGRNVNSTSDESYPVISPDGKILYFTREGHKGNTEYRYDKKDQDIWYSTLGADGKWARAKNIGLPINEGYRSLVNAPNVNTLIVWGAPDGFSGVKISQRIASGWSRPETFFQYKIRKKSKGDNIFVGNDLKTLLISRNGDIEVLFKQDDDSWSEPVSLGKTINTKSDESIAFLAPDNVTLYFASTGHPGFGGSDLFVSRRLDDSWQKWSEPLNLGPTINTKEHESGFYLPASGERAYFHRERKKRNREIFGVKLPEKLRPTPVVLITGKVLDAKTKKPVGTEISYRNLTTNKAIGTSASDPKDGSYEVTLPARHKYGYFAKKKGYYPIGEHVDLTGLKSYKELKVNLFITRIEKGVKILLNNLFFNVSSSKLQTTSFAELDRLISVLKEYPKMVIQLNGHTDNQGGEARNRILSEHRARSVRNYLAEQGIDRSRIKVKGFGASQPIASNNTETGRNRNRRVEFEVVKIGS